MAPALQTPPPNRDALPVSGMGPYGAARVPSSGVANTTGGNAEALSTEPKVICFHGGLTLRGKRALPGGGPVSLRRLCPRPRLPSSVTLEATGPQVIHEQKMETNSVCLLSSLGAVAACRSAHGLAPSAQLSRLLIVLEVVFVRPLSSSLSCFLHMLKGSSSASWLLIYGGILGAPSEPRGAGSVREEAESKARRTAALCGSHAGDTARTNSMAAGGIRLLSREGKHQIPCSYRRCLKCK